MALNSIFRIEHFIQAAASGTPCDLTPIHPVEIYLHKIAGGTVTLPDAPMSRVETYLASLAGEAVTLPDAPLSRAEYYLAALCGEAVVAPTPISREDVFLAQWAESLSSKVGTAKVGTAKAK